MKRKLWNFEDQRPVGECHAIEYVYLLLFWKLIIINTENVGIPSTKYTPNPNVKLIKLKFL